MQELERYWRILYWNRLAQSDFEETPEVAARCRTAWVQICTTLPAYSVLPNEFRNTFAAYNEGNRNVHDMFADDRRLILCLSDLRDYLLLLKKRDARRGDEDV
jgi:hypothetical protein